MVVELLEWVGVAGWRTHQPESGVTTWMDDTPTREGSPPGWAHTREGGHHMDGDTPGRGVTTWMVTPLSGWCIPIHVVTTLSGVSPSGW